MPTRLSVNPSESASTTLIYTGQSGDDLVVAKPIVVEILGKAARAFGYDEVASADDTHTTAVARLSLEDGTRLTVTDSYGLTRDDALRLDRKVEVNETGTAAGLRIGFSTESEVSGAAEQDWQFFIPGTLYNRNDNDGDGVEDYLGTYVQDVRDDKNGVLGVLARDPRTGATFTVARLDQPTFDTADHAGAARRALLRPGNRYRLPRPGAGRRRAGGAARELPVLRGVQLQPGHRPQRLGRVTRRTASAWSPTSRTSSASPAAPTSPRRSGSSTRRSAATSAPSGPSPTSRSRSRSSTASC